MDEMQLEATSALYRRVAAIADGLGSESSDFGQVIVTSCQTLIGACRGYFPPGYRVESWSRGAFEEQLGDVPGVAELLECITAHDPEFALVGNPEFFRPESTDRGSFWVCIFLHAKTALAQNALVRFQRTET